MIANHSFIFCYWLQNVRKGWESVTLIQWYTPNVRLSIKFRKISRWLIKVLWIIVDCPNYVMCISRLSPVFDFANILNIESMDVIIIGTVVKFKHINKSNFNWTFDFFNHQLAHHITKFIYVFVQSPVNSN